VFNQQRKRLAGLLLIRLNEQCEPSAGSPNKLGREANRIVAPSQPQRQFDIYSLPWSDISEPCFDKEPGFTDVCYPRYRNGQSALKNNQRDPGRHSTVTPPLHPAKPLYLLVITVADYHPSGAHQTLRHSADDHT
jgi:hypothetical protein